MTNPSMHMTTSSRSRRFIGVVKNAENVTLRFNLHKNLKNDRSYNAEDRPRTPRTIHKTSFSRHQSPSDSPPPAVRAQYGLGCGASFMIYYLQSFIFYLKRFYLILQVFLFLTFLLQGGSCGLSYKLYQQS